MTGEDLLDDLVQPMPYELLFPKQLEVFNCALEPECLELHPNAPAVVLVEGPRYSAKTIAVAHRVIRHMWETRNARVGLVVKTSPSAVDGGVWTDMIDIAMPVWCASNIGSDHSKFEYTTFDKQGNPGPTTHAKSRSLYFRIRNYYGGQSELVLFSIQNESEVRPRLRSTRFSCLWFSELSNFKSASVLKESWEQLRMFHLKRYQHLWIGDTNPDPEGEDSWIYKTWFQDRVEHRKKGGEYGRSLRLISFKLTDNISLSKEEIKLREAHYKDKPGDYERDFLGKWVKGFGVSGKHFVDVFSRSKHVIGGEDESVELSQTTDSLMTGWDIGASVNHGAGIVEKRLIRSPDGNREWSVFCVIDSIKHTDEHISTGMLAEEMLAKMTDLETDYNRNFDWTHYADDSAMTTYRAVGDTYDYLEVQAATDGLIELTGVPKPSGSVERRVRLIRRLLRENRLFVSGKCKDVIEMLENLRKGSTQKDFVVWDEHKHVFDWLSYVLYMECSADLEEDISMRSRTKHQVDLSTPLI